MIEFETEERQLATPCGRIGNRTPSFAWRGAPSFRKFRNAREIELARTEQRQSRHEVGGALGFGAAVMVAANELCTLH